MSYQVLARKWRPRTFRELVGQQHVLQALVELLAQGLAAPALGHVDEGPDVARAAVARPARISLARCVPRQ